MLWTAGGSSYAGGWRHGERWGQGVEVSEAGDRFMGDWRSDRKHGHGVLCVHAGEVTSTSGLRRVAGWWQQGLMVCGVAEEEVVAEPGVRQSRALEPAEVAALQQRDRRGGAAPGGGSVAGGSLAFGSHLTPAETVAAAAAFKPAVSGMHADWALKVAGQAHVVACAGAPADEASETAARPDSARSLPLPPIPPASDAPPPVPSSFAPAHLQRLYADCTRAVDVLAAVEGLAAVTAWWQAAARAAAAQGAWVAERHAADRFVQRCALNAAAEQARQATRWERARADALETRLRETEAQAEFSRRCASRRRTSVRAPYDGARAGRRRSSPHARSSSSPACSAW